MPSPPILPPCLVALTLLIPSPSVAQAALAPPALPDTEPTGPTLSHLIVTGLDLGGVHVELDDGADLDSVKARVGGELGDSGDAGGSARWLCIPGGSWSAPWLLWLESDEMGGGTTIMGFQWQTVSAATRAYAHCGPPLALHVMVPHAVRLGMSQAALLGALGRPTAHVGDTITFSYVREDTVAMMADTACYSPAVYNDVRAVLAGGRVARLLVWKVSVC